MPRDGWVSWLSYPPTSDSGCQTPRKPRHPLESHPRPRSSQRFRLGGSSSLQGCCNHLPTYLLSPPTSPVNALLHKPVIMLHFPIASNISNKQNTHMTMATTVAIHTNAINDLTSSMVDRLLISNVAKALMMMQMCAWSISSVVLRYTNVSRGQCIHHISLLLRRQITCPVVIVSIVPVTTLQYYFITSSACSMHSITTPVCITRHRHSSASLYPLMMTMLTGTICRVSSSAVAHLK